MPPRTSAASNRSTSSRSSRAAAPVRRRRSSRRWTVSAEVVRVLIGLAMLLIGVSLLIGLTIQGGQLTDWERNTVAPWFGSARWLLPVILILLGYYLERAEGAHWDWELTLLGSTLAYGSLLGVFGLLEAKWPTGGYIGHALAQLLAPLVTAPGAGVI